ncbi:MAG: hypothetical protein IT350_07510 [Deltaproteobacteria bacterium]|nr:hypothetical protein [Deltaproteobacteria bacterium]
MTDKPTTAAGYGPRQTELVRATCLYVATKLGDLLNEVVVIGGLVPSLLIDQHVPGSGIDVHVGTMDLDLGLTLAIFDRKRYQTLTERLRRAGFAPDRNEQGAATRQCWRIVGEGSVTVDFLIPPTNAKDRGGDLRNIEPDFAAFIAPGLPLAFEHRISVTISGRTILGEEATRDIWVCDPGAFVVMKALSCGSRGENKDAYDLYYVVRNFGNGIEDVLRYIHPLVDHHDSRQAFAILRADFLAHDAIGPRRVASFLTGGSDDTIQADVVGFIGSLVKRWQPPTDSA